ncbi:unnamed protein product [Didymodactylos carnosus]|uniref:Aspartate racemase n=1 Tax=Didymodactylos carnosus TaxID=1234261 RepID=A0A814DJQ1_9BILA|nr:unnamed protein product [Didymodactylos carnosus]CAF0956627.1 unnamed protein product [Didymodactylos carnosus]CAF3534839.1 unnamed protein product [Didymodactylos carnosus]CAF3731590.1 unnamed protein product [Didymodactylos carnosus]
MSALQQKVCGLLGGLSYVASMEYYRYMNELVGKEYSGHSSNLTMVSIDTYDYVDLIQRNEAEKAADYLLTGVERLVKSGIDFLLICSNTAHLVVPLIQQRYPSLPYLHIGDTTAYEIKKQKLKKIGFLGTATSMSINGSVAQRLLAHHIDVVFPSVDDIPTLHQIIINELSNNIFTEKSKQIYLAAIKQLKDTHQVEGVVLGCTEIPLLVNQQDVSEISLFDSTRIHELNGKDPSQRGKTARITTTAREIVRFCYGQTADTKSLKFDELNIVLEMKKRHSGGTDHIRAADGISKEKD